ncbi:hypothetical protein PHMEG_00016247 [Phytophthora megakarya]|uniref:Uncharacterized protein n=1 Tax=Phytophthora megakarya TaxID=4795 RepID=A0A225W0X4_9STRA|nr:hypothetical protein PHMEG_00016247 [Phytophthora megakarya]
MTMEPSIGGGTLVDRTLLPRVLDAVLTVRVGKPLGNWRGGWRKKCLAKYKEVAASPEAATKRLKLRSSAEIYTKPSNNDGQCKYMRLSADNF